MLSEFFFFSEVCEHILEWHENSRYLSNVI